MINNVEVLRAADAKAAEFNVPVQNLLAMVDVESNGKIFATIEGQKRPYILFEPHKFYARLPKEARQEAVSLKLASPEWNKRLYPKTQQGRWDQMNDARDLLKRYRLEPDIAYECASWGVGQVLGEHWDELGFKSVGHFIETAMSGVAGQIDLMLLYCKVNGYLDELQEGRWKALARGYNGPQYAKNSYHTKLAAAAAAYGGDVAEPDGMLRMGAKGKRVRELQALLVRAGYSLKVDGDYGPTTKRAVAGFQKANGLKVDGVYGPKTAKKLAVFLQSADDKPGSKKVHEIKEVIEGAVIAVGGPEAIEVAKSTVQQAQDQLGQFAGIPLADAALAALGFAAAVLVVGGIAYAAYGWIKTQRTEES